MKTEWHRYLKRKHDEICMLSKFAERSTSSRFARPKSIDDVIKAKQQIRELIKRASQPPVENGESNTSQDFNDNKVFGYSFSYEYQRLGLKLNSTNALSEIYFGQPLKTGFKSVGFFTSSCQAAISLSFDSFSAITRSKKVSIRTNSYWETLKYLKLEGWKIFPSAKLLFIDSSSENDAALSALAKNTKAKIAFLDTTCLTTNSPLLGLWIEDLLKKGIPCVLFRSHMKLDCMGMEYGRLGSVVLLKPSKMNLATQRFIESFWHLFEERCRLYGAYASLSQIYPFLKAKSFHKLNAERVKTMQSNNLAISIKLKTLVDSDGALRHAVEIQPFDHGCFFWVRFKKKNKPKAFAKFCKGLSAQLTFAEIPHKFIASYPWDFLALTYFPENDGTVLRVSVPDLPKFYVERVVKAFGQWLQQ